MKKCWREHHQVCFVLYIYYIRVRVSKKKKMGDFLWCIWIYHGHGWYTDLCMTLCVSCQVALDSSVYELDEWMSSSPCVHLGQK